MNSAADSIKSQSTTARYWKETGVAYTLAMCALILLAFYLWRYLKKWWDRQRKLLRFAASLPGPPALPIIGNLHLTVNRVQDVLSLAFEIGPLYQPRFRFWMGPKLYLLTSDADDIKTIMNSPNAADKDQVYLTWKDFLGEGLITGSGPYYKHRRRAMAPMMHRESLNSYVKTFDMYTNQCANELESKVGAGEFDILPFLEECVTDIVLETLLGTPVNSKKEERDALIYWHHRVYECLYKNVLHMLLHLDYICTTNNGRQAAKGCKVIRDFMQDIITQKRKESLSQKNGEVTAEVPRLSFIEQLMDWVVKTNSVDDKTLLDDVTTIYTASQDPPTEIGSFALLMLGMHQDIQDKVRQEVVNVLGNDRVDFHRLQDLKYTELVIKETLRLFPIAPLLSRQIMEDIELEWGTVPAGCSVSIFAFHTHRSPKYWDEPEKFIPERFLPENSWNRHPYAYIPFSAGPRACIGQKFTMMCLKTILANLVRRFRFVADGRLEDVQLKSDISMRSRNGYKVSITRV